MPKPEGHMTTIDTDPQDTVIKEESVNATTTTHQEVDDAQHEPGADANPNGEETFGEDAEIGQTNDGEVPEETQNTESDPLANIDEEIGKIRSELREEILNEIKQSQAQTQQQQQPPLQLTEEQWSQKEQELGIPRTAIKAMTSQAVMVYNKIKEEVAQMLQERFSGIETDTAIKSVGQEKGFSDINTYRSGINEFLSKYDVKHHSNPELLKTAYYYAKGKSANSNVRRARVESEKNKKISGPARPASPNGANRTPAPKGLNPAQLDVAKHFGMSPEQYSKLKAERGKPISV